jgi:hypothetical protein
MEACRRLRWGAGQTARRRGQRRDARRPPAASSGAHARAPRGRSGAGRLRPQPRVPSSRESGSGRAAPSGARWRVGAVSRPSPATIGRRAGTANKYAARCVFEPERVRLRLPTNRQRAADSSSRDDWAPARCWCLNPRESPSIAVKSGGLGRAAMRSADGDSEVFGGALHTREVGGSKPPAPIVFRTTARPTVRQGGAAQVRMPVGGAGGSRCVSGGRTGSAPGMAMLSRNRQSARCSGRAALV